MKILKSIIALMLVGILLIFSLPVSADDPISENALFVAPDGDDSYTREQNDIDHPWATPQKAWENAQAGDTVYFRGGTYNVTSTISTKFAGYQGTTENPITFQSYPGETATIDGTTLDVTLEIEKSWNIIKNLNFIYGETAIQIGWSLYVYGGIIENCTAQANLGGDNTGFVYVCDRGYDITVKDCRVIGPGVTGVHLNTACIIAFNARGMKILHNELSNAPVGIYYKHGHLLTADTGIEIAYNYIHDTGRFSAVLNTGYAFIHDNLLGLNNKSFWVNAANGGPNGDYNLITHNTIYSSRLVLDEGDDNDDGASHNMIRDNLLINKAEVFPYSDKSGYATNSFDYNLYKSGDIIMRNRINYTLDEWRSFFGQDASSLSGSPVFVNSSGTMTEIPDFYLSVDSPGKNAASDGKDMGADISLVIDPYQSDGSDKSGLNAVIEAAQNLNSAEYTQTSWSDVETALEDALEVQADGGATQNDVDAATTALTNAISSLVPLISGISLDCADYALRTAGARQTRQVVVTANHSESGPITLTQGVTFTSGDESVAIVDSQGVITAVAEGRTDIYAVYGGHQAQAGVFVLPAEPDGTNEMVVNESSFVAESSLFSDDFEVNRLSSYYEYNNIYGRFYRTGGSAVKGIGGSFGMRSYYGYYPGDAVNHPEPYGTWLKLAVGKTIDNVAYKPVGEPNTVERELYFRFYVKNYTQAQSETPGTSPIAQVYGYGSSSAGTRVPFMSVNVYYPDDESGVLVSDLKTGVFDNEGKPAGTADGPVIAGLMPIMQREFANQWHMVEVHAKLNDTGASNGQYHLWVDGQLQASAEDLNWVGDYTEYGINEAVIYNTNQWPGIPGGDTMYRMFDNMVVSRTKIGEAGVITANNADLLSIRSSAGKKIPDVFNAAVLKYTFEVEYGIESLTLTAETSHQDSTIKVGDISYLSGEAIPVSIQDGTATVSIEVTAPDGLTKKTYVIYVVTRNPYLVNETSNPESDWIFSDDFETNRLNKYFQYTNPAQFSRSEGVGLGGSAGMKVQFRAADGADYETGGLKLAFGRTPFASMIPAGAIGEDLKEVYVRIYVKNEKDWEGGGGYKLARLTALQTPQWAQSMIAHVWALNNDYLGLDPTSGTDAAGVLKSTQYNDWNNLRWLGQKPGDIPIFDQDHVGEWYAVETHVKLNDPGQSNGIFELWIDDHLVASQTNLNWIGSFEIGPGKGYGINCFLLENYWNTGTPKDQERYFDNLVISRSKIGLAEVEAAGADKGALTAAITAEIGEDRENPVYTLTAADYTVESWAAFTAAVDAAVTVEEDEEATQKEVDAAIEAITSAKEGLEPVQAAAPVAILSGPVITDGRYKLTYGLEGAVDIRAQDVTVCYDKNMFDFVSASPASEGITIAPDSVINNTNAGTVRFILTSLGTGNAVNGNKSILDMFFSPKAIGTGMIAVSSVQLAKV